MATCEFFYDFSSPFAYLGATQIQRICEGHRLIWRPFLLGALFNEIGTPTVPLATFGASKAQLVMKDQYRWAEHWDVAIRFPEMFPQKSVKALRLALQAPPDRVAALSIALFELMWMKNGDLNDEAALIEILNRLELDAEAMLDGTRDPSIKAKLRANTDEAVQRGICGAPTFIVGDLLFWGQDRLHFVKKALEGWVPKQG